MIRNYLKGRAVISTTFFLKSGAIEIINVVVDTRLSTKIDWIQFNCNIVIVVGIDTDIRQIWKGTVSYRSKFSPQKFAICSSTNFKLTGK